MGLEFLIPTGDNMEKLPDLIYIVMGLIIIPWATWVSASIFNQRQEIAVLKQILSEIRHVVSMFERKSVRKKS